MSTLVFESIIRATPCLRCRICGGEGVVLYKNLKDRVFVAPGIWTLKRCLTEDCGLLWLDPTPFPEDLSIAYREYYTHGAAELEAGFSTRVFRAIKSAMALATGLKTQESFLNQMYLNRLKPGRLLDIGCGDGDFIAKMERVGWQAEGIDLDAAAVLQASNKGLRVQCADVSTANYSDESFDAIVMSHVIEHLIEPIAQMKECWRILKRRGPLVIVTPNAGSWGHKMFGSDWRGLEPPRHLQIFSMEALQKIASSVGFSAVRTWTSCARAQYMLKASLDLKLEGRHTMVNSALSPSRSLISWLLQYSEYARMLWNANSGEELVLFAVK